jgi:predicted DNA-binding ribbon-helix-helix protein
MALTEARSITNSASAIQKRSVRIAGHPTSISLEDAFWEALREIAGHRQIRLSELVEEIDADRSSQNLSSAIRVYVLGSFRSQLAN